MRRTATAVICFNDKIFFFQRDNIPTIPDPGKWQMPGGYVEENETPDEAVRRELIEEASYCPRQLTLIGTRKTDVVETSVYWSYVSEKEISNFKLGEDEGQDIKFMTIDEALTLDLTNPVKYYLQSFGKIISKHLADRTIPTAAEFGIV